MPAKATKTNDKAQCMRDLYLGLSVSKIDKVLEFFCLSKSNKTSETFYSSDNNSIRTRDDAAHNNVVSQYSNDTIFVTILNEINICGDTKFRRGCN